MDPTLASGTKPPGTETLNRPASVFSDGRVALPILAALWFVVYMVGLSTPALLDDADTVHAEAAREMVFGTTGSRFTPTASAIWKKLH